MLRFARYTLRVLKIVRFELASWARLPTTPGHQCEATVSVFRLGFTPQHAVVRQRFVPVLKEAHIATWSVHGMCCTELLFYSSLLFFDLGIYFVYIPTDLFRLSS